MVGLLTILSRPLCHEPFLQLFCCFDTGELGIQGTCSICLVALSYQHYHRHQLSAHRAIIWPLLWSETPQHVGSWPLYQSAQSLSTLPQLSLIDLLGKAGAAFLFINTLCCVFCAWACVFIYLCVCMMQQGWEGWCQAIIHVSCIGSSHHVIRRQLLERERASERETKIRSQINGEKRKKNILSIVLLILYFRCNTLIVLLIVFYHLRITIHIIWSIFKGLSIYYVILFWPLLDPYPIR